MGGARGRKRLNIQAITQPEEITSLSASEHQKFKPLARLEIRTGRVKESVAWSQHPPESSCDEEINNNIF